MRNQPGQEVKEDDLTFLAGWMYADLFLAMMIVFLATVTFVPEYLGNVGKKNLTLYSYSEIYRVPMIIEYEDFNGKQIASDIAAFKDANGLPQDAEIIYAQIVAAYNKTNETPSDAIRRAQAFIAKIDAANAEILASASTTLSTTTSIPITRVVLKLSFATKIQVSGSGK